MAEQQISCPFCGQVFALQDDQVAQYLGQRIPCSKCQGQFTVVQDAAGVRAVAPAMAVPPIPGALAQPAAPVPPRSGASGLAIAGLICGIVGLITLGLLGIPGLICSILAMKKAKREQAPRGLAIAGTVVSSVSVAILLVFALALPPALMRARAAAMQVACMSNLRQIGLGTMMYSNDNRGHFPSSVTQISQYLSAEPGKPPMVLECPACKPETRKVDGVPCSYILVRWPGSMAQVRAAADQVLAFEPLGNHGGKAASVLYVDGHVELCRPSDAIAGKITLLSGDPSQQQLVELAQAAKEPLWARVAAISRVNDVNVLQKLADTLGIDRNITGAAKARLEELQRDSAGAVER